MSRLALFGITVVPFVFILVFSVVGSDKNKDSFVDIKVPELSDAARHGRTVLNGTCAACHGKDASGTDKGPPLIHPVYRPSHHADGAIHLAIANGVRQHHWNYGAMPPQPDIDKADIPAIIAFIREVQRANRIK